MSVKLFYLMLPAVKIASYAEPSIFYFKSAVVILIKKVILLVEVNLAALLW